MDLLAAELCEIKEDYKTLENDLKTKDAAFKYNNNINIGN